MSNRDSGLQRIGMIAELPSILSDMNVDPSPLFASMNLDLANFSPATRLTIPAVADLLDRAISRSGCPHIGLLCGLRFQLQHHGIIGDLMRTAPTLGQALASFVKWQPLYSSSAIVFFHRHGPDYAFGFGIYAGPAEKTGPIYDSILGVALCMVRQLTGQRIIPVEFLLGHRPAVDPASYWQLLGAPVRFNQVLNCMVLSEEALRLPLPGSNSSTHRDILKALHADGRWTGLDWRGRTRHELRRSLITNGPQMPQVAGELGVSARTLRRKLDTEGTTFEVLRDEVRGTLASELLELTDLPISEIGFALGFASPNNFSESFSRWSGMAPSSWRESIRGRTGTPD